MDTLPMVATRWEADTRFVSILVATGYLVGEQAQSLLLVGPPSAGKSALIGRFKAVPTTYSITDLTSEGLRRAVEQDERNSLRHLLVDDLNRVFARRGPVAEQTAGLLTSLMSGDAGIERVGRTEYNFTGKQVGVIASMTGDLFRMREADLIATGLLSRFYVVKLSTTKDEEDRVIRNIAQGIEDDLNPLHPTLHGKPLVPVAVESNFELADEIIKYLAGLNGKYSRRGMSQIMRFLKAVAFLRGHTRVTRNDLKALKLFTPYFQGMSGKIEVDE